MISNRTKNQIMELSLKGYSNVAIAKDLGINRRTVIKYKNEMEELGQRLDEVEVGSPEFHEIIEKLAGPPQYKGKNKSRSKRKYTEPVQKKVQELLEDEQRKINTYGTNYKNKRNLGDIHEELVKAGFDISYSTVVKHVSPQLKKIKEVYIKQNYDYGDRVEFDFGERKVTIAGKKTKVFLAVLCSSATNYRDFYVYSNQKIEAFLDSQVRFFEKVGVYKEVVYDNMKNVVKKFVGRNERELTDAVLALSNYYGFSIVLTNPYSGNEKGSVERSVAVVTQDLFAKRDIFDSWDELIKYVRERQNELNKGIEIKEEQKYLKPARPRMEIAQISQRKVNKYCFVREDKNDYSVPERFVGAVVTVKRYPHSIEVFSKGEMIARHNRIQGENQCSVDIRHYLKTLLRKPGALKHSVALGQIPKLKDIYENYYSGKPREFLVILMDNKELLDTDELCEVLLNGSLNPDCSHKQSEVEKASKNQLKSVSTLFRGNNYE